MELKKYISESKRGTAATLAAALGISPSYLSQLASGDAPISPERAVAIEKETDGQVTRPEMFPDNWQNIWPELVASNHRKISERRSNRRKPRITP